MTVSEEARARFAAGLDELVTPGDMLGVAVSGGADSLALLLLAHEARPGRVRAATVDHRLRDESVEEATTVARYCADLGIPHDLLVVDWKGAPPIANVEAAARDQRYRLLTDWAADHGLTAIATAHHADDQAETLLMRLARGAGLSGLAGVRAARPLGERVTLVRPLLEWSRAELRAIAEGSGLPVVEDPMNRDPAFDRPRLRTALAEAGFGDAPAFAASARHLAGAEEALAVTARRLFDERARRERGALVLAAPADLPRDLQRRLLLLAFDALGRPTPRGPDLARAMEALEAGRQCTLGGLLLRLVGADWHLSPAPPRRAGDGA
ncbi:tRNA lysidine(34) synthetase TilS [Sphingomicrobium aestuariivivum]|uniref:tRNA lysidine(34) synthetase TilS n=1 Tax=Sphingomicrobium aestuariivivum TaxID=1582356 RepID=UPI001FD6AB5B|nr:tRNA lysidine(34) synthetase TilS [Sphingomicrobium aestuariivivum]MCJ8190794.1 tRNA lysidine(34) synthetase TilS [Sphingomicrobium aestuariivivum]